MKTCTECHESFPLNVFGQFTRKRTGKKEHWSKCNGCRSIQIQRRREQYRDDWIVFFETRYGIDPKCEICSRDLFYMGGNLESTVCFDHRTGDEQISVGPSSWCMVRPCNEANQEIFLFCEFGILCRRCNASLPTANRLEWLQRAMRYTSK